jgi:hypothetical protein
MSDNAKTKESTEKGKKEEKTEEGDARELEENVPKSEREDRERERVEKNKEKGDTIGSIPSENMKPDGEKGVGSRSEEIEIDYRGKSRDSGIGNSKDISKEKRMGVQMGVKSPKDPIEDDRKGQEKEGISRNVIDIIMGIKLLFSREHKLEQHYSDSVIKDSYDPTLQIRSISTIPFFYEIEHIRETDKWYIEYDIEQGSFSNLEELMDHGINKMKEMLDRNLFFLEEPKLVTIGDVCIKDPNSLGLRYDQILEIPTRLEDYRMRLAEIFRIKYDLSRSPFLKLHAIGREYDREIRSWIKNEIESDQALATIKRIDNYLRIIECNDERWNMGTLVQNPKQIYVPFTSPFGVMNVIRNMPNELFFRIQMIRDVVVPPLELASVSDSTILPKLEISSNKTDEIVTGILSVGYQSEFEDQISMLFMSMLMPGYFRIYVDPREYQKNLLQVQFVVGIMCKMLLIYNKEHPETTVARRSAEDIERSIVTFLIDQNMVEYEREDPEEFPLNVVRVTRQYRGRTEVIHALQSLRTDGHGGGWLGNGTVVRHMSPEEDWIDQFYSGIERRPKFLDIPETLQRFELVRDLRKSEWRVYNAAKVLINATRLHASTKHRMSGILDFVAERLIIFFRFLNRYTWRNYYNGFRMKYADMLMRWQVDNDDKTTQMPEVRIRPQALIYFCRSVPQYEFSRPAPATSQMRAESCLLESYLRWASNVEMIQRYRGILRINTAMSNTQVKRKAMEMLQPSYFKKILIALDEQLQLKLYEPKLQDVIIKLESLKKYSPYCRLITNISNKWLLSAKALGIAWEFYITRPMILTKDVIRKMREDGDIIINHLSEESKIQFTMSSILQLYRTGMARQQILESVMRGENPEIRIPVKLRCEKIRGIDQMECPFELKYFADLQVDPNIKDSFEIKYVPHRISRLEYHEKEVYDEICKSFNVYQQYYIRPEHNYIEEFEVGKSFLDMHGPVLCLKNYTSLLSYYRQGPL